MAILIAFHFSLLICVLVALLHHPFALSQALIERRVEPKHVRMPMLGRFTAMSWRRTRPRGNGLLSEQRGTIPKIAGRAD
jgi:hypothetical protein